MLRRLSSSVLSLHRLVAATEWRSLKELTATYKKLSKSKLSTFVVFSTATGFVVASKDDIDWRKLGITCVGTFGASASANALNQIYEIDKDALMLRTRLRPLPLGRISIPHAVTFAIVTGLTGIALLSHQVNETAAVLAGGNIVLYACIYTPLKQVTYLNTWVGAIVGAIPPIIGWTAATDNMDPGAWVMFAGLYFWQIPHFLSLAWTYKADYINAGFRMLSKYDSSGRRTAACAFRNCLYLLPLGWISTYLGVTNKWFGYTSSTMTVLLALSASAFYQQPSKQLSRSLFKASIVYLPLWLMAMMLHRQSHHTTWKELRTELHDLIHYQPPKSDLPDPDWQRISDTDRHQSIWMHPVFAPVPFAPLPTAGVSSGYLWEGLDDVIREMDESKRT